MQDHTDSSNPEIELAERRLADARLTRGEIAAKISRLGNAYKLVNSKLAAADPVWLEQEYFEGLIAHANDGAKAPSTKPIETLGTELRLLRLAADNFAVRLWKVSAAEMIAESDELYLEARIFQLRANAQNVETAMAIASVRDQIGEGALVTVENGVAEALQRKADELTEQAGRMRREGESKLTQLAENMKGKQDGR